MKIETTDVSPPIPSRDFDWQAIDSDTYDGAPDSGNRNQVGYGRTEREAIENLMEILADADDCDPNCWCCRQEAGLNLLENDESFGELVEQVRAERIAKGLNPDTGAHS